ncbi:hypothetical protein ACFFRR_002125 [Megaselia abdita]
MEYKFIWIIAIFCTTTTLQSIHSEFAPLKHSLTSFPRNSWHDPPPSQLFTSKPLFPQLTHINSNSHDDDDVGEEGSNEITTTHEPLPYFSDPYNSINVSTQLGTNIQLHCRVDNLRGKTVSWMRRKGDQLTLITFGHHTYSSDSRYSLEFEEPNDWKLLVQYANERDDGAYECQVSSHPPLVLLVNLAVIVPKVEIVDERGTSTPEKYYKAGSTIELQCVISKIPQPTSYITWMHGTRMLNYDTSRGGISVKTEMTPGKALSRLYIANANRHDSGNYTCLLSNEIKVSVLVHVLNGEEPAAMQHAAGSTLCLNPFILVVFYILNLHTVMVSFQQR